MAPEQTTDKPWRGQLADNVSAISDYDEIERFVVFVEQFDIACDLLAERTLARARAALVGVDNLANLLLHRHANSVFASGEGSRWLRRKRYTHKERKKILGSFDRMATVATKEADGPTWRTVAPILDDTDAAVMRVGHMYRNVAYHEDRHNAALIVPLTALYAQALGRAFSRFHQHGWSYSIDSARAERLAALGHEPTPDSLGASTMLDFGRAARDITERLTEPFVVEEDALRVWLADDIVERCTRCAAIIAGLMEDGMPADRLNFTFFWSQFWEVHGADEEWQALEDERDRLFDELPPAGVDGLDETHPAVLAYRAAEETYITRGHDLQRAFEPSVASGDTVRIARRGNRLSGAKDTASLLSRYGELDLLVERLEKATLRAVTTWDQLVDHAVNRAREA